MLCAGGPGEEDQQAPPELSLREQISPAVIRSTAHREMEAGAAAAQELAAVQAQQDMKESNAPANQAQLLCQFPAGPAQQPVPVQQQHLYYATAVCKSVMSQHPPVYYQHHQSAIKGWP